MERRENITCPPGHVLKDGMCTIAPKMTCPSSEYELVSNTCRIKPVRQQPKPPPNTTEQRPMPPPNTTEQRPMPPPNTTEQRPKPMLQSNQRPTMPLQTGNIIPYTI
jgi:hypothetical protein